MDEKIKQLFDRRIDLEAAKEVKAEYLAYIQSKPEYIALMARVKDLEQDVANLENEIKTEAVETYKADPSAKLPEAIKIKIFKVAKITDETKARDWCLSNFTPALKLDTKVFEKAAKDGTVPAELVTVEEEPRAQIATDLSKYL